MADLVVGEADKAFGLGVEAVQSARRSDPDIAGSVFDGGQDIVGEQPVVGGEGVVSAVGRAVLEMQQACSVRGNVEFAVPGEEDVLDVVVADGLEALEVHILRFAFRVLADEQAPLSAGVQAAVRPDGEAAQAVPPFCRETQAVALANELAVLVVQVHVGDAVIESADPQAMGAVFEQGVDFIAVGTVEVVVPGVSDRVVVDSLGRLRGQFHQARPVGADPEFPVVGGEDGETGIPGVPGRPFAEVFFKDVQAAVSGGGENPSRRVLGDGADVVLRRDLAAAVDRAESEVVLPEHDALHAAPAGADPEIALPVREEGRDAGLGIPALLQVLALQGNQAVLLPVIPKETAPCRIDPQVALMVGAAGQRAGLRRVGFEGNAAPGAVFEVLDDDAVAVGAEEEFRAVRDPGDETDVCGGAGGQGGEHLVLIAKDFPGGPDVEGAVGHFCAECRDFRNPLRTPVDAVVGQDPGLPVRDTDDGVDGGIPVQAALPVEVRIQDQVVGRQVKAVFGTRPEDLLDGIPVAVRRFEVLCIGIEAV